MRRANTRQTQSAPAQIILQPVQHLRIGQMPVIPRQQIIHRRASRDCQMIRIGAGVGGKNSVLQQICRELGAFRPARQQWQIALKRLRLFRRLILASHEANASVGDFLRNHTMANSSCRSKNHLLVSCCSRRQNVRGWAAPPDNSPRSSRCKRIPFQSTALLTFSARIFLR